MTNAEREENQMVEVLIQATDRGSGDPLGADTRLPIVPRVGDEIEVWVGSVDYPEFLKVNHVVLSSYAPEYVVVSVETGLLSDEGLRGVFAALKAGDRP